MPWYGLNNATVGIEHQSISQTTENIPHNYEIKTKNANKILLSISHMLLYNRRGQQTVLELLSI